MCVFLHAHAHLQANYGSHVPVDITAGSESASGSDVHFHVEMCGIFSKAAVN